LLEAGLSDDALANELHWDSLTYDLVKSWRVIHLPITLVFGTLALAHVIASAVFWGWK
jgi:hypothetical protein